MHTITRYWLGVALLMMAAASTLSAQAVDRPIGPRPSSLFVPPTTSAAGRVAPANVGGHGVTGAIIGGAVLGVGGAILGNGLCDSGGKCTSATIAGAAVGAVVGAVIGAFIGGAID